jgi:hypothetical protein
MSIVYDYLKQIKESKEPAKADEKVALPATPAPVSKSRFSAWVKYGLVFALCVGIALTVYFLAPRGIKPVVRLYHPPAPTPRAATAPSTDPSYVLEGIIYNPSQPFAIINGKMLEVKSTIGDYTITKITPDSVTLTNTQDKTSRTIRL